MPQIAVCSAFSTSDVRLLHCWKHLPSAYAILLTFILVINVGFLYSSSTFSKQKCVRACASVSLCAPQACLRPGDWSSRQSVSPWDEHGEPDSGALNHWAVSPAFLSFICFAFNVSLLTFSNKLLGRDLGNWVAGSKALTQNMFRGTWVNVLTGGYEWGLPSQGEWTVTSRAWVWRMFAHFCLHSVLTSHMEDAHYLSRARGKSSLPLDLGALPFIHWYHTQSVR